MILLSDIRKSFDAPSGGRLEVLSGVDLAVGPGTAVAIIGRSGCGKSTLLSILGMLESKDGGSYRLDDDEVSHLSDRDAARLRGEKLGFVFQRSFLLPHLSAAENVEVPLLHARNVPSRRLRARMVENAMDIVGISHRSKHRPAALSGGEQQLVAVARAIVRNPKNILADEPTGNLDPLTGERIVKALATLTNDGVTCVVMVTHDQELAGLLDRCYRLADGRLSQSA